jgi:hypothetical protein
MRRRLDRYLVTITHTCTPDEEAVEIGLNMWAAFVVENRRRKASLPREPHDSPAQVR